MTNKPIIVYGRHNFEAEEADEISFKVGESIVVLQKDEEFNDGWWTGKNIKGEIGIFPENYVTFDKPSEVPDTLETDTVNMEQELHIHQQQTDMIVSKPIREWDVQQVSEWVELVGFANEKQEFINRNINGSRLLELNLTSLKEVGVNTLSGRIKLMHSIILIKNRELELGSSLKEIQVGSNIRVSNVVKQYNDREIVQHDPSNIKINQNQSMETKKPDSIQMIDSNQTLISDSQSHERDGLVAWQPDMVQKGKNNNQVQDSKSIKDDQSSLIVTDPHSMISEPDLPETNVLQDISNLTPGTTNGIYSQEIDSNIHKVPESQILSGDDLSNPEFVYDTSPTQEVSDICPNAVGINKEVSRPASYISNQSGDLNQQQADTRERASVFTLSDYLPEAPQSFEQLISKGAASKQNITDYVPVVSHPQPPTNKIKEKQNRRTSFFGQRISSSMHTLSRKFRNTKSANNLLDIPKLDEYDHIGYMEVRLYDELIYHRKQCILKGPHLYIFKKDQSNPHYRITITSPTEILPSTSKKHNAFQHKIDNRTTHFIVQTQLELVTWINALIRSCNPIINRKPLIPLKNTARITHLFLSGESDISQNMGMKTTTLKKSVESIKSNSFLEEEDSQNPNVELLLEGRKQPMSTTKFMA